MIASDRWIRTMALEHGMIDPFVERLQSNGKISYGLSSYGYDVRVGSAFKIFHNLKTTLVDPKAFDPQSFVDHEGDCIIPPNSFALAATVERFRIPRNVLSICLGKCVTGDTRVLDAGSGTYRPIREFGPGRRTLALGPDGLAPHAVAERVVQGVRPVWRLRTCGGREIRATANHPFLGPAGWTLLADLRPGDRVAALGAQPRRGGRIRGRGPAEEAGSHGRPAGSGPAMAGAVALAGIALPPGLAWDRVERIEPEGRETVYDLCVPGAGNFVANGLVVHNSTYARCGIIVNVTPLEPEWEGVLTLEISNTTPLPAKIYAEEGIAQLVFFLGNEACETSYADRRGKYQGQAGLTLPRILPV